MLEGCFTANASVSYASDNELTDQFQCSLPRVSYHTMSAVSKTLEAHKLCRQGSNDIGLAFDWRHRVIFPAHNQRWTTDTVQARKEVKTLAIMYLTNTGGKHRKAFFITSRRQPL